MRLLGGGRCDGSDISAQQLDDRALSGDVLLIILDLWGK